MDDLQKRSWAEVFTDNIRHNYRAIRSELPEGCRFLGVVKADAYGHGALRVSQILEEEGADYLAVACLDRAEYHAGCDLPCQGAGVQRGGRKAWSNASDTYQGGHGNVPSRFPLRGRAF